MRSSARVALAAAALLTSASFAQAKVKIDVDLDHQTMHIEANGKTFNWKVSSGKFGYETPNGTYKVLWMDKDHFSDTYDKAPMPNAIFFKPGFAIHGSPKSAWGHPASHGCVRLPIAKSAVLFALVKAEGAEVTITGETPETIEAHVRHHHAPDQDDGGYDDAAAYRRAPAPTYPPPDVVADPNALYGSFY